MSSTRCTFRGLENLTHQLVESHNELVESHLPIASMQQESIHMIRKQHLHYPQDAYLPLKLALSSMSSLVAKASLQYFSFKLKRYSAVFDPCKERAHEDTIPMHAPDGSA